MEIDKNNAMRMTKKQGKGKGNLKTDNPNNQAIKQPAYQNIKANQPPPPSPSSSR